jgi:hypothetical protein
MALSSYLVNSRAVARLGEAIVRNGDTPTSNYRFDSIYGKDPYFRHKHPASVLCMPISKLGGSSSLVLTDVSALSGELTCNASISAKEIGSTTITLCPSGGHNREGTNVSEHGRSKTSGRGSNRHEKHMYIHRRTN